MCSNHHFCYDCLAVAVRDDCTILSFGSIDSYAMLYSSLYAARNASRLLKPPHQAGHAMKSPTSTYLCSFRHRYHATYRRYRTLSLPGHPLGAVRALAPLPLREHGAPSSTGGAGRKAGIVWFRNDLRLHDHEALSKANAECTSVLPVFCFDPREYNGIPVMDSSASSSDASSKHVHRKYNKTGPYRAAFTIDAVHDLRNRLREHGSDLMVVVGKPEDVIPQLAKKIGATAVYCHSEVTYEETKIEEKLKRTFLETTSSASRFHSFWTSSTLHHVEDVRGGDRLEHLPQRFDEFKRRMEGVVPRKAIGGDANLKGVPVGVGGMGEVPTMRELGMEMCAEEMEAEETTTTTQKKPTWRGGETEALRQLTTFLGSVSSSMTSFSGNVAPWLAGGCLSPRRVLEEVVAKGVGEGTMEFKWIKFELLYRDFFKLVTKRAAIVQAGSGTGSSRVLAA